MKRATILLVLVFISGCAKTVYVHPTKGKRQFKKDKHDCTVEAEQRAANHGAHGNPFLIRDFLKECLRSKGWRPKSEVVASQTENNQKKRGEVDLPENMYSE